MTGRRKVVWIQSHPIQYFSPLFRALAARDDIDLEVAYCSRQGVDPFFDRQFGIELRWDIDLLSRYEHRFLRNLSWKPSVSNGFLGLFNPGIVALLWRRRGSVVVIQGWRHATMWLAALAGKLFGCRICVRGDNAARLERFKPRSRRLSKRILLTRILFPLVDRFLCVGKENRFFYEMYGAPAGRLAFAPFSIDASRFVPLTGNERSRARAELGLSDDAVYALFVGKLTPVKRPLDIMEAYSEIAREGRGLLFVGTGSEAPAIEELARSGSLRDVKLFGFVNQSKLPLYYAAADFLVLPSQRDPWGLVVNEAMACGLPVIASDTVCCGPDLIEEGSNGFVYPAGDVRALARAMERLYADADLRKNASRRSLEMIKGYSIEATVEGLCSAFGDGSPES